MRIGGSLVDRYQCYLSCANDGNGGDSTRNGKPLFTFDEWLNNAAECERDDPRGAEAEE